MLRHYWHVGKYQYVFYEFLLEQIIERQNLDFVLDAGCGFRGSTFAPVKHLVGVDINRSNVLEIHQTKQGDFIVASLTHLPFRSEVFDTIVNVDVLEHIKGKIAVFAEIARISRKSAHFVGSTTNQLNPLLLLDELLPILSQLLAGNIGQYYNRHSRLNPETLTNMTKTNGFNIYISFIRYPQLYAASYEYKNKKMEWFGSLWILFDKITDHFRFLKSMMVFEAVKQ